MRASIKIPCPRLIAAMLAALFASLSLHVSAGEPIGAEGTLEPAEIVDVRAQVTGAITSFGADPSAPGEKTIDYGSRVGAGTILARIDDVRYSVQFEIAKAAVARAEAELKGVRAKAKVGSSDYSPFSETVYEAALAKCMAELKLAQIDLENTLIRSPVRGVVLDRRVNVGQIVTPASALFLIGKGLPKLEVWASVLEKDIARIKVGMPATFTVSAYPTKVFQGKVAQIRMNAAMTQNVVTYTVVVATDNADGKLLPYLTAHIQFH